MTTLFGLALGIFFACLFFKIKRGGLEALAHHIVQKAEEEVKSLKQACEAEQKQKEVEQKQALEALAEQKLHKISLREEKLDSQLALIDKKLHEIEKKEKELHKLRAGLEEKERLVESGQTENQVQLERLAGLTSQQAKEALFSEMKETITTDCAHFLFKQRKEVQEEVERHAASVIATAINRLSLPTLFDAAVTVVPLPNQEMKGRVIGREGRNIRILEQATGVNVVIDDTPNTVVISGFDPVRREIAQLALKELIQDGRIHPTRIEEVVAKAEKRVHQQIDLRGEEAAIKCGGLSFHQELIRLLGKLHFRYSFCQNVLAHSIEVSHLMAIMAAELKLDVERARRIGLLHDIGKAVSHEREGSHALIGAQFALEYGESEEVANGIGCHHDEVAPQTIEASLCSAADRLSGGRLGARLEAADQYVKRSAKLEHLCRQFEGVEKAYAMHAGREVRIIVEPELFDDAKTLILARDIAKKIEKELSYPGKIKVTVIREKRSVEYAS